MNTFMTVKLQIYREEVMLNFFKVVFQMLTTFQSNLMKKNINIIVK